MISGTRYDSPPLSFHGQLICIALREARLHLGLNQRILSGRLKVSLRTFQNWERGLTRPNKVFWPAIRSILTPNNHQPNTSALRGENVGGQRFPHNQVRNRCHRPLPRRNDVKPINPGSFSVGQASRLSPVSPLPQPSVSPRLWQPNPTQWALVNPQNLCRGLAYESILVKYRRRAYPLDQYSPEADSVPWGQNTLSCPVISRKQWSLTYRFSSSNTIANLALTSRPQARGLSYG